MGCFFMGHAQTFVVPTIVLYDVFVNGSFITIMLLLLQGYNW